jgi:2,3-bisphosphoglycerate-independent phosphoglycerate mutase
MTTVSLRPKPFVLIILDGWGHREDTRANAIAGARKPCWDQLWKNYPHALLSGSGKCVGLPSGQMGNSEVGHMNMGAGRVIHQDLTRIDLAIENGEFFKNTALCSALDQVRDQKKALHVLGLLSPGGVHSQEKHIQALLELAARHQVSRVYLHAFLDGRDTPPRSAQTSLEALVKKCRDLGCGQVVSIIGRYYAMDRDKRWERVQKAYDLLTQGKADFEATDPVQALQQAYQRNENDEFVQATLIGPAETCAIQDNDAVVFMNFRADRARQLTQAFMDPDFKGFERAKRPRLSAFVTLTEYDKNFPTTVAFPPVTLKHILAEYLSEQGLRQLRIAETEKYAHVTYFFNGGLEQPFPGEDRVLIPSPKVATYDLKPEMSAPELTDRLVQEIRQQNYDVIICNFANPDMVGHSGNFPATVQAIEVIDSCLGRIIEALKEVQGEAIITSDHGNAELMFDETTQQPHTAHTHEEVPALYFGRPATVAKAKGILADLAPTLLYLLGFTPPPEMTGKVLFTLSH